MKKLKTKKLDKIINKISFGLMRILWQKERDELISHVIIIRRTFQLTMTVPAFITDLIIIFFLYVCVKFTYLFISYFSIALIWFFKKSLLKILAWLVPSILIALAIFIYQNGKWSDITNVFSEVWNYFFN